MLEVNVQYGYFFSLFLCTGNFFRMTISINAKGASEYHQPADALILYINVVPCKVFSIDLA